MRARVIVLVASLAALLLLAVPALAAPDGPPVRFYALSKATGRRRVPFSRHAESNVDQKFGDELRAERRAIDRPVRPAR
jgi:hypothetical protein